ncbi:MAG TPA: RNA ligase family protein [Gemmataceae bacterium]|jgi:hypothetical protein|nr:RNA ligase family protein [Gemmataceae bacterium]
MIRSFILRIALVCLFTAMLLPYTLTAQDGTKVIDFYGKQVSVLKLFGQTHWGDCSPGRVDGTKIYHAAGVFEGLAVIGASRDDFVKYPRTPHLFGSMGTADDKRLGERESCEFVADPSLIVEEKLDGTNVGIHFASSGQLVLQCRGHLITTGMHAQYDLFKQWAAVKRDILEERLQDRFILFGEWLYARHSIHYRGLPHYFFEFDIYDKVVSSFLSLEQRLELLEGTGIQTVPVVHMGALDRDELTALIGPSCFDSEFENPATNQTDQLMEGLYLRTEHDGAVSGRAKFVRPEFIERVKLSEHWQHQAMVPNLLREGADIWS